MIRIGHIRALHTCTRLTSIGINSLHLIPSGAWYLACSCPSYPSSVYRKFIHGITCISPVIILLPSWPLLLRWVFLRLTLHHSPGNLILEMRFIWNFSHFKPLTGRCGILLRMYIPFRYWLWRQEYWIWWYHITWLWWVQLTAMWILVTLELGSNNQKWMY